jgi:hypothetical protein
MPIQNQEPPIDIFLFSQDNVLAQAQSAPLELGYKKLTFYVDDSGVISKTATPTKHTFYLSPSGGTLRDSSMNIVLYSAKFDLYKGYGKA